MRIYLLFLFIWGFTTVGMAEKHYRIFKTTEGVTLKDTQGKHTVISKRMKVSLGDILCIPQGGKVGILETESKQIYYSATTGEVRVVKIVVEAKKQVENSISAVNKQIANSITEQQQSGYNFSIVGAAHRGTAIDTCTQQVYTSLYQLLNNTLKEQKKHTLHLRQKGNDESFHFLLDNLSQQPLFVNVLKIDKTSETPYVCLQSGHSAGTPYILLNAAGTRDLQEITFARDEETEVTFLLFGSESPFDSQLLQRLFDQKAQPYSSGCILYTSF